jgi:photosystem II stability/assembly factor-like uncharacterized protein
MNKIIKFIFLFITFTSIVYPQNFWEKINSPTSKKLNSIVFIDSLNGWVSGDSGLIIHTTNGGEEWETQFLNDSLSVINLFFLNDQIGWGLAWSSYYEPYGTFILNTTNGGTDWNSQYLRLTESFVNSIYFLDTLTGFVVGYPNVFHKTTNGGATWEKVKLDTSLVSVLPPYNIIFYSSQYGYACGGARDIAGVIWRTTDRGENWATVVSTLISEPLYDLHLFDSLHVIAMGGDPEYGASQVITTDGGDTWEYTNLGVYWFPVDIGFRKPTEGWAPMGAQKKFLYTTDFGENWTEVNTPDSTSIIHICFPDSFHGYGIGENGEIIKYVYQKPSDVQIEPGSISSFYLAQNYPNPFNPSTKISYSIPEDGFVKLAVYNLLGEEVATIVNAFQKADRYEVNFNAAGLSSGVYVYKIESANYTASKKLVLMK